MYLPKIIKKLFFNLFYWYQRNISGISFPAIMVRGEFIYYFRYNITD